MKKLILVLVFALLSLNAYGASPTRISGSTVSYSSAKPHMVTFNSVTSRITMWNESVDYDCYVDIRCVTDSSTSGSKTTGWMDDEGYTAVIKLSAGGKITPNVVTIDFETKNLGFYNGDTTNDGTNYVTYFVTGERLDL